jgi:hypothetical protein
MCELIPILIIVVLTSFIVSGLHYFHLRTRRVKPEVEEVKKTVNANHVKVWVQKTEQIELRSQELHITHLDGRRFSATIFESVADTLDYNSGKMSRILNQRLEDSRANILNQATYGNFWTFYWGTDAPTEKNMKDIDTIVYEEPKFLGHEELITWVEVK